MENETTKLPQRKPDWLRVKAPTRAECSDVRKLMRERSLHTVCEEAACPNLGECWTNKVATFLILGDVCTRGCAFCNVKHGKTEPLDPKEPQKVAESVVTMQLKHAVITSVDRDDLPDGGAAHFAETIIRVRAASPSTSIEVLTPDFRGKEGALEVVIDALPDVFNHNLETVPRLYKAVRKGADYLYSLEVLRRAKELAPNIFTKSGIMVGLGEEISEVHEVMDDMRAVGVDFITIGQYLRPTKDNIEVARYVTPDEFKELEKVAYAKGFLMVSASPLTRSSHHAGADFAKLKAARANKE